ncbi:unnamed protein product [Didymodactylos carnosus]|uniref:Endonuclease/exonuclease/phosphatase domain-containing protein n=1 Tax=Didymodactylos carnosus TaxID=1234261 RepID=A0A814EDK0_9BILA|nr:unnamed protein product [Didymodactylos carnosus]CAF3739839.1 unnamed protein product [Didymodactylos carnosus]
MALLHEIKTDACPFRFCNVYRRPSSRKIYYDSLFKFLLENSWKDISLILSGDFSINTEKAPTDFREILQTSSLTRAFKCFTTHKRTKIDNIFCSKEWDEPSTKTHLEIGKSPHFLLEAKSNFQIENQPKQEQSQLDYENCDLNLLRRIVSVVDSKFYLSNDVNEKTEILLNHYSNCIKACVPLKKLSSKIQPNFRPSKTTKQLIQYKKKEFYKMKRQQSLVKTIQYEKLRNKVLNSIRGDKYRHFSKTKAQFSDSKIFWKGLNRFYKGF